MTTPIRVILADDHALVRSTLAEWLRTSTDLSVVAQCSDADQAVNECIRLAPHVVVLDIDMPGLSCFDAARTIRSRLPDTKIIFLSAFLHDRYIDEALRCGASAFLTKGEPPQKIVDAIRTTAAGGIFFSPEVQSRMVIDAGGVRLAEGPMTRAQTLTQRELEVLRYIARGMSKKEIANVMHLSVKTVDNHSTSLMSKLDIHDRVELARFAIREGLAEP
ncbi:MAG TPA: response regulator transcription factor [Phycisphaerales bacterium]|jgi:DNA-binding NarL/FixJ family response regulator|nr:response regulator transcription factor [Phycisphaerales bacterium]